MRDEVETNTEIKTLGIIALLCYSTTLAAMLTSGYTLLAIALRAIGHDLAAVLNPAVM